MLLQVLQAPHAHHLRAPWTPWRRTSWSDKENSYDSLTPRRAMAEVTLAAVSCERAVHYPAADIS